MVEKEEKIIKSSQEQATAAWINQVNINRLYELVNALNQQDKNLANAMAELDELKRFCGDPSHILGSDFTKHGEIAEHMQVNFSNARRMIEGLKKEYTFDGVGRTAPEDYLCDGLPVQSKFYNGTKNSLSAIQQHLEKYPDFVKNGGSYDIPQDQYTEIKRILEISKTNPSALSKEEYRVLNAIKEFQKNTGLSFEDDVNSAVVGYKDVQTSVADKTIKNEEKNIKNRDKEKRQEAHKNAEPTLKEGTKVALAAGVIEGGFTFCLEIHKKRKEGKQFADFTSEDWKEIGLETGKSGIKGSVRGGVVYALTNYTKTPANVASAYVTAAFGVTAQLYAYSRKEISSEELLLNCEAVCMDATVSAVSSLIGQTLIPVPVLGSVIGNVVGQFVYEIGKEFATGEQQKVFDNYRKELKEFESKLSREHQDFINKMQMIIEEFESLEKLSFDKDVNIAFNNSVKFALSVGVCEEKILKTEQEVYDYFMC